jgi:hypothetical protein
MSTTTYTPLAHLTLTKIASSIIFNNIPATYRDLIFVINTTGATESSLRILFNDSSANFSWVQMIGNGASASSNTSSDNQFCAITNAPSVVVGHLMDYAQTDKHKTVLARSGSSAYDTRIFGLRWASNEAVNTVRFQLTTGDWQINTTACLYGVIA